MMSRARTSSVHASLLATVVLAMSGAACAVEVDPETADPETADPETAEPGDAVDDEPFEDGAPEVPQPAAGEAIPVEVRDGPFDGSLLFVPVTIDGQGPFSFVLDTGATNTTIDATLADELGLPETGVEGEVAGVTGEGAAAGVEVASWDLGGVALDDRTIVAIELGDGEDGLGVDGLIGGDVLAGFGTITLDYDEGTLLLAD